MMPCTYCLEPVIQTGGALFLLPHFDCARVMEPLGLRGASARATGDLVRLARGDPEYSYFTVYAGPDRSDPSYTLPVEVTCQLDDRTP